MVLGALWLGLASASFARVDVNRATQAELESVRGIGPAMSAEFCRSVNSVAPFAVPPT